MEEAQGTHAFPSIQRPFLKMKGQAYQSASEVVQVQKRVVGPDKEDEEYRNEAEMRMSRWMCGMSRKERDMCGPGTEDGC